MLLRGVQRARESAARYQFRQKVRVGPTSNITAVPANAASFQVCPSIGFRIPVQSGTAIWVRRYMCTLTQAAASIYVVSGQFGYAVSPFALANNFIAYPMTEAESINGAAGTAFGFPAGAAAVFALIDDWYEFDDAWPRPDLVPPAGIPSAVQLWSNWLAVNPTLAAINATVQEQIEYDIYQSMDLGQR